MLKILTSFLLIAAVLSISYDQFQEKKKKCEGDNKIRNQCIYDPIIIQPVGLDSECAHDYYNSQLCYTSFSSCNKLAGKN